MEAFPVLHGTKTMEILLLFLCLILQVQGESGILKTRYYDTSSQEFVMNEYCIGYSHAETPLPKHINDQYHPLLDGTESDMCKTPSNVEQLKGTIVQVVRGNCTFVQKGYIAQKAGANGTIVITDSPVMAPSINISYGVKIPVVLLTAEDHKDIIRRAGDSKVQGVLYNPEVPLVDWNLLLIWVMAVGTVAIGGYWCGITAHRQARLQRKRERATAVQATGTLQAPCSSESSEEEDYPEEEEESVTITPIIVLIWVCMIFRCALVLLL